MTSREPLPQPLAALAESFGAPGLILDDHGPHHWKCVALTGLEIARLDPTVDLRVLYIFAQLHDSQRLNEYSDPEHGPRAAEVAAKAVDGRVVPGLPPAGEMTEKLIEAIRDHTTGPASEDMTIGACWDADRFNLWRVGIVPDVAYMSTRASREHFDELSHAAKARIVEAETTWESVAEAYRDAGL